MEWKFFYNAVLYNDDGSIANPGLKPALDLRISGITEYNGGELVKIATGQSNVSLGISQVDEAKYLIIETNENISLKLNASDATAIPIAAYGTPKKGVFVCSLTGVTAIYVTNSSGNTAEIKYLFGS